jgi:hypothetical protein
MDVWAPATMLGGSEVVKMNPGAYERTTSMRSAEPAMYPPTMPYALPRVPGSRKAIISAM